MDNGSINERGLNFQKSNDSTLSPNLSTTQDVSLFLGITVALLIIMTVVILFGNLLVLMAVLKFRTLRDNTGIIVANVALADLIMGLSLLYDFVFYFFPELGRNEMACIIRYVTVILSVNASTYFLSITVIDRFIAVACPLQYNQIVNRKRSIILVFVIWTVNIGLSILPLLGVNNWINSPSCIYELVIDNRYRCYQHGNGIIFASAMMITYGRILIIARQHLRRIRSESSNYARNTAVPVNSITNSVMAVVVLAFNASWLPFFAFQFTMLEYSDVSDDKIMISHFLGFLGITNSMMNPFIYAWKNKLYYKAFRRLLGFKPQNEELTEVATVRPTAYRNDHTSAAGASSHQNVHRNADISLIDIRY